MPQSGRIPVTSAVENYVEMGNRRGQDWMEEQVGEQDIRSDIIKTLSGIKKYFFVCTL